MRKLLNITNDKGVKVSDFFEQASKIMDLTLYSGGRGKTKRFIIDPSPQRLGLALTGYTKYLGKGRVGIFGKTEKMFFEELERSERKKVIEKIMETELACIVFTRGYKPSFLFKKLSSKYKMPIFGTSLTTSVFIENIIEILVDNLSPVTVVHGSLVDIYGIGVLILGRSGIGKSESVLELVTRGHRLVSDDTVFIQKRPPEMLYGSSAGITRDFIEVRGLGILNIRELFGVSSVIGRKRIDIVVELVDWDKMEKIERLGGDDKFYEILGVKLPYVRIPVSPGRSISVLLEVAALNHVLKKHGYDSVEALEKKFIEEASGRNK